MKAIETALKGIGRALWDFRELRELRFYQVEDDEGHLDPAVDLTLVTDSEPPVALTLRAQGVREFHATFGGRPVQVLGFDIQSVSERQLEGIHWRVFDSEDNCLGFQCREIELVSLGEVPS